MRRRLGIERRGDYRRWTAAHARQPGQSLCNACRTEQDEAAKHAKVLEAALAKGEPVDALLKEVGGSSKEHKAVTRNGADLDPAVQQALFRMQKPVDGKPSVELMVQGNGDQVVLVLNQVAVSDKESSRMLPMVEAQLAQGKSAQAYQALLEQARNDGDIIYRKLSEQAAE